MMRRHVFYPFTAFGPDNKPFKANWCAYIDKPLAEAQDDDYCLEYQDHPNHVQPARKVQS